LQGRDYQLDLAARLNKTQVISNNTPLNQQAGYYCGVCDCILRDSASYLDHINGKYHNRALGMTMRVEQKGLSAVKERLEMHRKRKEAAKKEDYVPDGFEKRVVDAEERERREKEEKKAKRKAAKKKQPDMLALTDGAEEVDPEMAAMMGFSGFGGK
jgi:U4/U6.U5 tri-snRNP component SNU23